MICNVFSLSVGCSFTLLFVSFDAQFLGLIEFHLAILLSNFILKQNQKKSVVIFSMYMLYSK